MDLENTRGGQKMKSRKLKWYGVLFSLFMLFLYVMGTYDLFMMLGHNEAYYLSKGYGQAVHEYFTGYPPVGLVLWIVNLLSGLISPLCCFLEERMCLEGGFYFGAQRSFVDPVRRYVQKAIQCVQSVYYQL